MMKKIAKSTKKNHLSFKWISVIVITLLVGLFLGSFFTFLRLESKRKMPKDISQWRTVQFVDCQASFKVPPQEEPYYYPENENHSGLSDDKGSGRYWDIPRGGMSPTVFDLLGYDSDDTTQMNAWFAAPNEASDYVSAAVSVSCVNNENNIDNANLKTLIKQKVDEYNAHPLPKPGIRESFDLREITEINKWGESVLEVNIDGNTYYVFATSSKIYEIMKEGASEDAFVQQTSQDILDNLRID
jgi:hypothetical protein